jgi:hypothetical protein
MAGKLQLLRAAIVADDWWLAEVFFSSDLWIHFGTTLEIFGQILVTTVFAFSAPLMPMGYFGGRRDVFGALRLHFRRS